MRFWLQALGELKDTVAELKMEKEALEKAVRIEDEERAKMEERERVVPDLGSLNG